MLPPSLSPASASLTPLQPLAVNQIDVRAEQAAFLPTQLAVLSPTPPSLSTDPAALAASRARYINFYTTLWLIANDVIVGRALGLVLSEQSEPLGVAGARVIQVGSPHFGA